MSEPTVVTLADPDACSLAAAERIVEILDVAIDDRGEAHWVTTGGSTPAAIYRHLASEPLRDELDWRKVRLWWTDERFVPLDHPLSNAKIAFDMLLDARRTRGVRDRRVRARRAHRARPGRPDPRRRRPSVPDRRRDRRGPRPGLVRGPLRRGPPGGRPRRERRRLAGVRPDPARRRAGRPHPVGLPGLGGIRPRRAGPLGVPAPTHVEPHVAAGHPQPGDRAGGRASSSSSATATARPRCCATSSAARGEPRRCRPSSPAGRARPGSSIGRPPGSCEPGARRATDPDPPRPTAGRRAPTIADVFLGSFHATYDFPLAHTDDEVRGWIARRCCVRSAGRGSPSDARARVVGMMVVEPGELDQLYVAPDRLGEGIGRRLLDLAKERSPDGLTLYTFQVNDRARRFYERNGFVAEWFGDGAANEEGQPDVRYVWRPDADDGLAAAALRRAAARRVARPDGAAIAVFRSGHGPPLVLVHGATADHTTWRTSGPLLAARHTLHAIDRRGRGAPATADPASPTRSSASSRTSPRVVDAIAAESGGAGRRRRPLVRRPDRRSGRRCGPRTCAGSSSTRARRRRRGRGYQDADAGALRRIEALVAAGDRDEALATFMREIVGMPEADLAAFRADPIWPRRAAAVDTTIRELRAETSPAGSLDALGEVRQPVLQILGGASSAAVRRGDAGPRRAAARTGGSSRSRARGTPPTTPTPRRSWPRSRPSSPIRTWQTRRHGPELVSAGSSSASSPAPSPGAVVGGRTARGCLPNIVVGILGAIVGGWLARQLGFERGPGLHRRDRRRDRRRRSSSGCILEAVSPHDRR